MIIKIWLSSGVLFVFSLVLAMLVEGETRAVKFLGFCTLLFLVVTTLCAIAGIWGIS